MSQFAFFVLFTLILSSLTFAVPNSSFEIYAPNFLEKFIESHTVMFQGNSGLKPKEGEITSQPWQWPINFKVCAFEIMFFYSFSNLHFSLEVNSGYTRSSVQIMETLCFIKKIFLCFAVLCYISWNLTGDKG